MYNYIHQYNICWHVAKSLITKVEQFVPISYGYSFTVQWSNFEQKIAKKKQIQIKDFKEFHKQVISEENNPAFDYFPHFLPN